MRRGAGSSQSDAYDVFISYSHRRDTGLAEALQSELQRFACPWYRPRVLRVFRDKTSLSASPFLWPMIEQALGVSGWFVLMASTASAQSPWVRKEVDWWVANRSPERMLIALTEGTITWAGDDFDWRRTDAIPPSLSGVFAHEPLWIDLRALRPPEDPGTTPERPRLGDIVAEFAAPVHGVPKDSLVGEHVRRRRQTKRVIRQVVALLATLALIASIAAVVAFAQRDEAIRQATIATAGRAGAEAEALLPRQVDVAQLVAVEAYRMWPDAQTRSALFGAVTASPALVRHLQAGGRVSAVGGSMDGRTVVAGTHDGRVLRWRAADGARTASFELAKAVRSVTADRTGRVVAATDGTSVLTEPPGRLPKTWGGAIGGLALSPSGRFLVVAAGDRLTRVELATGALRATRTLVTALSVAMPDETKIVVSSVSGQWEHYTGADLRRGLSSLHSPMGVHGYAPTLANNGAYLTFTRTFGGPLPIYPTSVALSIADDSAPQEALSHGTSPQAIAVSDDGVHAAVADGSAIYVSSVEAGVEQTTLPGSGVVIDGGLRFLGDRDHLVSASGQSVALWDLDHAGRIAQQAEVRLTGACSGCGAPHTEVSADGKRVAVQTDGSAGLFSVYDWGRRTGDVFEAARRILGWSADGSGLFLANTENRLETLSMRDSSRAMRHTTGELPLEPIAVSRDGRDLLILDTAGALEVRAASTGSLRRRIEPPEGLDAVLLPVVDFQRGIVVAEGLVEFASHAVLYDLTSGKSRIVGSGRAQNISVGAGHVVVQRRDGDLEFWDRSGTRLERRITRDASFSPDELSPRSIPAVGAASLVQRTSDGVIVITDLTTRTDVGTLRLPGEWVQAKTSMRLTDDGTHLVTAADAGGENGLLVRWALTPSAWISAACASVGRDLTAAEWRRYVGTPPPENLSCAR
ncbi:TIR domain-containing protein [Sphaerisporangium sp. TRM90804]|uniref:TIR domain-containing protein n=1 Tax=Sphaerisporangium sp. TRM90804 TaxID=3031113 RepID=UPI002446D146|nr:TIR domain-containing protein [Sphaerisporangium sp. TRM90804]MDH2429525.1 TIR domain-containing protein [Sphaerisporangium sp. TRM90804]